ncbi:hypothetical protein B0H17DRAFT_1021636 [Mycena rosella]|uniref:Fe2OG dioxygenase domain-containing protein n=1 Tax=Mycena rosella TaxID=1033263 RepID=A0AAD7CNN0_MYCRO|nr:hypothetical protein B0H17DRAFT_1021636 [Mycena rosella]
MSIVDQLKILRRSLKVHVPYTGGVHPVKAEDLLVFYATDEEGNARVVDLGNATEAHLTDMAAACQAATFGLNQTDVLDESYRKAGKMNLSRFSPHLDVVASGLLDAISPDILDGQDTDGDKILRAELLYKLNVYGPGSFFKAHKDTPRGEAMIGSLVVVFPTAHKGGELTLAHDETTWTFDSAAEIAAHGSLSTPAVAYVAFYSDVTHAVEPVVEGHRVTLTYNLFLTNRPTHTSAAVAGHRIVPAPENAFQDALRALLADREFFPAGGLLAYGLAHQYPMPTPPQGGSDTERAEVGFVLQLLKGSDARIRTVSERVGLATHVKMLYDSGDSNEVGHDVLADHVLFLEYVYEDNVPLRTEVEQRGIVLKRGPERRKVMRRGRRDDYEEPSEGVTVHWVTKITKLNRVGSGYVAQGNEASLAYVYGNAALFVSVPKIGEGVRADVVPA